MRYLLLVLAIVSLVILVVTNIMWWYAVKVGCKDYLKLTGDAPTVAKADEFLGMAVSFIEAKGLTEGNSGILFHPPTADLKIWYNQIKGAKLNAEAILQRENTGSLTQLERDNALMKIREVVLDEGEHGLVVTSPPHLSWYPHQGLIALWWLLTILALICGVIIVIVRTVKHRHK